MEANVRGFIYLSCADDIAMPCHLHQQLGFFLAFNFLSKCRICHIFYKAAQTGLEFL